MEVVLDNPPAPLWHPFDEDGQANETLICLRVAQVRRHRACMNGIDDAEYAMLLQPDSSTVDGQETTRYQRVGMVIQEREQMETYANSWEGEPSLFHNGGHEMVLHIV
jgi:hypothetical protein